MFLTNKISNLSNKKKKKLITHPLFKVPKYNSCLLATERDTGTLKNKRRHYHPFNSLRNSQCNTYTISALERHRLRISALVIAERFFVSNKEHRKDGVSLI